MKSIAASIHRDPHWRTIRTLTGDFPALIGPPRDPRVDRPLAGPEVVIDLPRFEGHMLACPKPTPRYVPVFKPSPPAEVPAASRSSPRPSWAWPVLLLQGLTVLVLIGLAV